MIINKICQKHYNLPILCLSILVGGLNSAYGADTCPFRQVLHDQILKISSENKGITIAHRGSFDSSIPENSLNAFRNAYTKCRAAVEADIRTTKDVQLIVFHDLNIGKMLTKGYNPITQKGFNPAISDMMLRDIQSHFLINQKGEVTDQRVPTLKEMLADYISKGGTSIIYFDIKNEDSIISVVKEIIEVSKTEPSILKTIVLKFTIAKYPTPKVWKEALKKAGINETIMVSPVLTPQSQTRIDAMEKIDPPPDYTDYNFDNTSRSIAWWSLEQNGIAPSIEVVLKIQMIFTRRKKSTPPKAYMRLLPELQKKTRQPGRWQEWSLL